MYSCSRMTLATVKWWRCSTAHDVIILTCSYFLESQFIHYNSHSMHYIWLHKLERLFFRGLFSWKQLLQKLALIIQYNIVVCYCTVHCTTRIRPQTTEVHTTSDSSSDNYPHDRVKSFWPCARWDPGDVWSRSATICTIVHSYETQATMCMHSVT